jgi:endoglucanase
MKPLIKRLTEAFGPSGAEAAVRDLVREEIRGVADYTSVDPLGNLVAGVRKQTRSGRRVLVAAHLDEIGFIVSHVDDDGFARLHPLGAVSPLACVGNRVRFADGRLGVIGLDFRRDEPGKPPAWHELFIDVGAASRAANPLRVGDVAVFARPLQEAGDRLVSKALDNRLGVAVLIETLRRLRRTPHEVAFVFTVQEEVGMRGAGPAAHNVEADVAIAVDVTATGDTPNGRRMDVRLGGGPAVKVRDARMIADPRVKDLLARRGAEAGVPTQWEILEGGSTDAAAIQLARGGVPAGALSLPARYVHSSSEMADLRDAQAAVTLLLEVLHKPIEL